jgi:hypothetical protein
VNSPLLVELHVLPYDSLSEVAYSLPGNTVLESLDCSLAKFVVLSFRVKRVFSLSISQTRRVYCGGCCFGARELNVKASFDRLAATGAQLRGRHGQSREGPCRQLGRQQGNNGIEGCFCLCFSKNVFFLREKYFRFGLRALFSTRLWRTSVWSA